MAETLLLSDLCAICHTKARKYTCPRCGLRSCSLPCVKRHKLRSQCTGARDPARYHKRSDLATPGTLDQDFNFITGIERSFGQAERTLLQHGIPATADERLYKGEARLLAEIERSGAIVRRAPNGMSRNRQNATHWHKKRKRLFWTVEWVLPESRHITNISETELIQDSYVKLSAQKSQSSRKRKAEESNHSFDTGEDQDVSAEVGNTMMGELIPEPPKATDTVSNTFFYLHQPLARSRTLALINLAPDSSLAAAVRGRVLLEFPTIYVLSYPPSDLPAGYVCHGDRITTLQDDQDIQPSVVDSGNHDSRPSMSLDPATIIETLQKDLAG